MSDSEPQLTQEKMNQILEMVMADSTAAAVSVAAVENGELSQCAAWGWAEKNQREMTPDTKVRIASISKVAVGLGAMAMAEDGLVDLDAPLSTYWGAGAANPYSDGQPTVRTLMTHTSSLKSLDVTRGLNTLTGLLNSGSSWRDMEPGDGGYWAYNNFGFCILGTTLELAAGETLEDYCQRRLFQPMGLQASFYGGNMEEEQVATLYTDGGVGRTAAAHTGQSVPDAIGMGASYYPGGLTISAVDMARLTALLAADGVYDGTEHLEAGTVEDMETPRFTVAQEDATSFEQCLVLRRQEDLLGRDQLYYHTGSSYGVYALMSYDPETRDGVVVITTGAPYELEEHGIYSLCARLTEQVYAAMEE